MFLTPLNIKPHYLNLPYLVLPLFSSRSCIMIALSSVIIFSFALYLYSTFMYAIVVNNIKNTNKNKKKSITRKRNCEVQESGKKRKKVLQARFMQIFFVFEKLD